MFPLILTLQQYNNDMLDQEHLYCHLDDEENNLQAAI